MFSPPILRLLSTLDRIQPKVRTHTLFAHRYRQEEILARQNRFAKSFERNPENKKGAEGAKFLVAQLRRELLEKNDQYDKARSLDFICVAFGEK